MANDFRQSLEYQDLMRNSGAITVEIGQDQVAYVMRPKILPFISSTIIPRIEDPNALQIADDISRKYRSINLVLAPKVIYGSDEAKTWEEELKKHNYTLAGFGIAPTKTLIVNIQPSDDEILAQMKSKTRYNIRLSERRGVTTKVIRGEDLIGNPAYMDEFYAVYSENCQRIGMKCDSRDHLETLFKSFNRNCFLVHAYDSDGEVSAVASYLVAGDTLYYQMNGSTEMGRKNFAPNLTVWEGILEGKRRDCRWLDFDGIYDDRYPKAQESWKGFSRFKLSFGGTEISYVGAYIKWFPFLKKKSYQTQ